MTGGPTGGVAGRLWLGTPGRSDLISGKLLLTESVLDTDRDQVAEELKGRLYREIARGVWERTGLLYPRGSSMLARIEWLVLVGPDQENGPRLQAFVEGWSAVLPPGVRAAQLTPMQVQELGRRLLGRLPSRPPDPREEEG